MRECAAEPATAQCRNRQFGTRRIGGLMNRKPRTKLQSSPRLRAEAEAHLSSMSKPSASAPLQEVIHELQVHQIELEMQNEALRQTQVALEESRDRYSNLYEFAPVGYLTLSYSGLITQANLTAAELLGMERGKLRQRRFSLFVTPENRDRFHNLFVSAMQHGERQVCDLALQHGDGTIIHAQVDCLRVLAETDTPVAHVTLTDISELKHAAEAAMRVQRNMTESIEEEVRARTLQLRALSVELSLSEERVRREVALDLHDDLSQVLAIVKYKLTCLDRGERSRKSDFQLKEIGKLVDQASNSIRSISTQLCPPVLHSLGLAPALDYLAEEMESAFDLVVRIHDEGLYKPIVEPGLSMAYRALRELLINVAKHAKVSTAEISCRNIDDFLILTVTDGGVGFDYDEVASPYSRGTGFGLLGMRERLEFLGGEMQVKVTPGVGTRVTLKIPLIPSRKTP